MDTRDLAQSLKYLPHKHMDLILDPSTHIKRWVWQHTPVIPVTIRWRVTKDLTRLDLWPPLACRHIYTYMYIQECIYKKSVCMHLFSMLLWWFLVIIPEEDADCVSKLYPLWNWSLYWKAASDFYSQIVGCSVSVLSVRTSFRVYLFSVPQMICFPVAIILGRWSSSRPL